MQAQLQAGMWSAQILALVAESPVPPAFFNFISSLVIESSRFPISPHEARAEWASGKHCRGGCPPWDPFSPLEKPQAQGCLLGVRHCVSLVE